MKCISYLPCNYIKFTAMLENSADTLMTLEYLKFYFLFLSNIILPVGFSNYEWQFTKWLGLGPEPLQLKWDGAQNFKKVQPPLTVGTFSDNTEEVHLSPFSLTNIQEYPNNDPEPSGVWANLGEERKL